MMKLNSGKKTTEIGTKRWHFPETKNEFNPENQWLVQMMHVLFGAILALFSYANGKLLVLWESNLMNCNI